MAAAWCGEAGPAPSGAGCVGWRVWSAAEGEPGSCKSMVSAHAGSASHIPAEGAGRRGTCSDDGWARHFGCCCSSGGSLAVSGRSSGGTGRSRSAAQTGPDAAGDGGSNGKGAGAKRDRSKERERRTKSRSSDGRAGVGRFRRDGPRRGAFARGGGADKDRKFGQGSSQPVEERGTKGSWRREPGEARSVVSPW